MNKYNFENKLVERGLNFYSYLVSEFNFSFTTKNLFNIT